LLKRESTVRNIRNIRNIRVAISHIALDWIVGLTLDVYKLISCFFFDIKKDARRILIDKISNHFRRHLEQLRRAANRDGNLIV